MSEFEKVLQDCLRDLEQGASSVEECLHRHPQYALQLEPILLTSAYLERARDLRISDSFRRRVRAKLIQEMQAHPRKPARSRSLFSHTAAWRRAALVRLATGFAAVVLAVLVTGTAFAQSALPGETFYSWKLTSEDVWRAVAQAPVEADLAIAERRVDEMIAVTDDPALYAQTLSAYLAVLDRLQAEVDTENEARIHAALDAQLEELDQAGIDLPQPESEVLPPSEAPTSTPATTPTGIPLPILETPHVEPTELPQIAPTLQNPSEPTVEIPDAILPTVEDLPGIVPTVEIINPLP